MERSETNVMDRLENIKYIFGFLTIIWGVIIIFSFAISFATGFRKKFEKFECMVESDVVIWIMYIFRLSFLWFLIIKCYFEKRKRQIHKILE